MRQLKGTVLQALAHERIRCAAASCGVVGRREGWKPADRKPSAPPLTIESPSCAATRPPVVSIDRSVDREQLWFPVVISLIGWQGVGASTQWTWVVQLGVGL